MRNVWRRTRKKWYEMCLEIRENKIDRLLLTATLLCEESFQNFGFPRILACAAARPC